MKKQFLALFVVAGLMTPAIWAKLGVVLGYQSLTVDGENGSSANEPMGAFGTTLDGTIKDKHMIHGRLSAEGSSTMTGGSAELGYRYAVSESLFIGPLVQYSVLGANESENLSFSGLFYGVDMLWQFGEEFGLLAKYTLGDYERKLEYKIMDETYTETSTISGSRLLLGLSRRF
jgi:hypothetical protein